MLPGSLSVKGIKRQQKINKNASAENCGLLRHYAPSSGEFLPTFRVNLSVPPSRVKNSWILLNS